MCDKFLQKLLRNSAELIVEIISMNLCVESLDLNILFIISAKNTSIIDAKSPSLCIDLLPESHPIKI